MIETLQGKVLFIEGDGIVLDVSGFGIKVFSTASLLRTISVGDDLFCYTFLQVSAAGISIFGFLTERERDLFLDLISYQLFKCILKPAIMKFSIHHEFIIFLLHLFEILIAQ